jgi:hypothetical protein
MEALKGNTFDPEARPKGPQFLQPAPLSPAAPGESDSAVSTLFPDLPSELKPQRADGSGALTLRDLTELERSGARLPMGADESVRAEQAVMHLKRKMAAVAAEFADGQINHAQFQAIYTRYCEQWAVIERIRSATPGATAWHSITDEGETAFLRQQFAAHVVGCVLVDNLPGAFIRTFGQFDIPSDFLAPILGSLQDAWQDSSRLGCERSTQIEGGRWLTVVPGAYASTIVVFSQEPSAAQRAMICDLNADFERANLRALKTASADPARLVYPHRTLFEDE